MIIVLLFMLVSTVSACNIRVVLVSQTDRPVWAQFTFHNGAKSQILNPSILTTYSELPHAYSRPIGSTSAFLEGVGVVDYQVHDTLAPRMGMRLGVTCAFGDCGGRG
ncbi:hypothetical protein OESDEN_07079 [Oesophagostomum dentatum]|uniref:Uncharacterized protein n=1 Tax=Oesophagostomum dentatum TaxID=61180 RepID=A0A0B1TCE4_OESDE|nr:hypothetical protein OESDEN_07079 [Oesophagostomum dentatum]